jgi:hypothetical protein
MTDDEIKKIFRRILHISGVFSVCLISKYLLVFLLKETNLTTLLPDLRKKDGHLDFATLRRLKCCRLLQIGQKQYHHP